MLACSGPGPEVGPPAALPALIPKPQYGNLILNPDPRSELGQNLLRGLPPGVGRLMGLKKLGLQVRAWGVVVE